MRGSYVIYGQEFRLQTASEKRFGIFTKRSAKKKKHANALFPSEHEICFPELFEQIIIFKLKIYITTLQAYL